MRGDDDGDTLEVRREGHFEENDAEEQHLLGGGRILKGAATSSSSPRVELGGAAPARSSCGNEASVGSKMTVPVYFINLDRHPEREARVREDFKGTKSRLVRVPGFDAAEHSERDLTALFGGSRGKLPTSSTTDDPDTGAPQNQRVGRLGSIGCTISHLRAVAAAYDAGESHAVILEDDQRNEFESRWPDASLTEFISRLPANWKIVNLGAFFPEEDVAFDVDAATGEPVPKKGGKKRLMAEWVGVGHSG